LAVNRAISNLLSQAKRWILMNDLAEINFPVSLASIWHGQMQTAFPEPEYVATNGVTLETFTAGPPAGKPIVLCHGWPELAFSWRHQIPVLAAAGYHVIAPNQRGYGHSSRPEPVTDYDIEHLTADLTGLLDHFGHDDALFVGHDWGAIVVWNLAMLHRPRVSGVINLSVPFLTRGERPWVDVWEELLGGDHYIVHFNRQPGVADAAFAANTGGFLRNLYRTEQWLEDPVELGPGMPLIAMASATDLPGTSLMSEEDLAVFVAAFEHSGFTGGINWYRNFNRNWSLIADQEQRITQPTLMIYGDHDMVPQAPGLGEVVADLETANLDCGHWIQQEQPDQTNQLMLDWLARRYPA
jgi:pimeloyl-ACP methyl ester carboxylesterase